ncbi:MAG: hypothetical protein OHK0012_10260 [Synechococcales cyanobacterium]
MVQKDISYVESDYFQLEPGNDALFCEIGCKESDLEYHYGEDDYYSLDNPLVIVRGWVRLTFIPQDTAEPAILINLLDLPFNEILTPEYSLLMEEEPDPYAVSGGQ